MNDHPQPEIVRMWLPRTPESIFALGHAVCRCDATTGHISTAIAYCNSPVAAQALVEAIKEKIGRTP